MSSAGSGPGQAFTDLGHAVLQPGQPRPAYNSNPPTSGPHVPAAVTREGVALSDDQLLQALQAGDVVIMYGGARPPAGAGAVRAFGGAAVHPVAGGHRRRRDPRPAAADGRRWSALAWAHWQRVQEASDPQRSGLRGVLAGARRPRSVAD